MSIIGSKLNRLFRARKTGFTLIEVMVAAMVLVAGVVFIYESFFMSLDLFGYCSDYLNVSTWMSEKVWEIQDSIRQYGFLAHIDKRGSFTRRGRHFAWNASCNLISEAPDMDLYNIALNLSWRVGVRSFKMNRAAYATYVYKE
jgi:prepilin-type N-terminal cleavage/methylation domain-containing protein